MLAGPQEVVRQSQSYSLATHRPFAIPLADKWRGDLATCCHLPKSPLTLCVPQTSVISKDRPHLHPTPPLGQSFATVEGLIYSTSYNRPFFLPSLDVTTIMVLCCFVESNTVWKEKQLLEVKRMNIKIVFIWRVYLHFKCIISFFYDGWSSERSTSDPDSSQ